MAGASDLPEPLFELSHSPCADVDNGRDRTRAPYISPPLHIRHCLASTSCHWPCRIAPCCTAPLPNGTNHNVGVILTVPSSLGSESQTPENGGDQARFSSCGTQHSSRSIFMWPGQLGNSGSTLDWGEENGH
ncbi:hypothetical protein CGRA01v4_00015 [Colletotrichum graminicola]|nr:hypothetical protein CGRA01v4_00015 [Colletotrichum graminicola]